jgi:PAT family beta-lactamase induction signal transducer AmpG
MDHTPPKGRTPHPAVYLLLYLPFGAFGGYFTITLGYVLRGGGVSVAAIAGLTGLYLLPNTWKVLWAPLVDTTLSAKAWYVIGAMATAAVLSAASATPMTAAGVPMLSVLSFLGGAATSFCAMAAERLMAFATPEAQKGRAGGWSQAGNMGGQGLGGGAALWLSEHLHPWTGAASLGLLSLACTAVLLAVAEPRAEVWIGPYVGQLKSAGRDVLRLVSRRIGLLACLICLLPMGSGAAQNLWGAVARDWSATADEVALISGLLSGLAAIVGSLAGGYFCDRLDRKGGYALYGVLLAVCAVAMALGPRTPLSFMLFATAYNLVVGATYGGYAAVTLEAIGQGAAATKFNLIASLSNIPILAMTLIDGQAQTRWGSGGMLYTEAAIGVAAVALFYSAAWISRGWTWAGLRRRLGRAPAEA